MTNIIDLPLPTYPIFKKFTADDTEWYDKFYANFMPYADLYFANMRVWLDLNDDLEVSRLGSSVIYRFKSVLDNNKPTTTILGDREIDATLSQLLSDIDEPLSFVPSIVVDSIKEKERFSIKPEPESFDYIFSMDLLGTMQGPEARKIRRQVSYAKREYEASVKTEYKKLCPGNKEYIDRLLNGWERTFTLTSNSKNSYELQALARNIDLSEHLNNYLWTIEIMGKIEGLIIFHKPPQQEYIILNHIKTSYNYKYIFDYMLHAISKDLLKDNFKYINFEQDLGLDGLREHKQSLKPVQMLEKYTIGLK